MSLIRILSPDVSNKIAAGEVIDRPASILKEFIENAIDAKAKNIRINILDGGKKLVQVIDDGIGMDKDDALLCIEPHATSKVFSVDDIQEISTLGFRGEALPSIASVTRFSLLTRQENKTEGTMIYVEGGSLRNVETAGCSQGTSISAKNIFFNLPARRKFLRTTQTENTHIQELALLIALANPRIAFDLKIDGHQAISVASDSDCRTRIGMLLGRDTLSAMIPVKYEEDDVLIQGYIARPGFTRSSRREQRIFVNGRPIVANEVYFGIKDGFHTMVMKGRFPPVILFIELSPTRIDVNVHPAKKEIRFREGKLITQIVAAAMRKALRDDSITSVSFPTTSTSAQNKFDDFSTKRIEEIPLAQAKVQNIPSISKARPFIANPQSPEKLPHYQPVLKNLNYDDTGADASVATKNTINQLNVIGSIHNAYVLAEGVSGLVLIDQNAAHKRIIFEKLLTNAKESKLMRQQLLIPITIELSVQDKYIFDKNSEYFQNIGFEIEDFGGNTYIISAVPSHFPQENITELIHSILDDLAENLKVTRKIDEIKIAQISAKQAVKLNEKLNTVNIEKLLEELSQTQMPYTCPEGKPVMINISYQEIRKRFGK